MKDDLSEDYYKPDAMDLWMGHIKGTNNVINDKTLVYCPQYLST